MAWLAALAAGCGLHKPAAKASDDDACCQALPPLRPVPPLPQNVTGIYHSFDLNDRQGVLCKYRFGFEQERDEGGKVIRTTGYTQWIDDWSDYVGSMGNRLVDKTKYELHGNAINAQIMIRDLRAMHTRVGSDYGLMSNNTALTLASLRSSLMAGINLLGALYHEQQITPHDYGDLALPYNL
jgi:hypothetical protein